MYNASAFSSNMCSLISFNRPDRDAVESPIWTQTLRRIPRRSNVSFPTFPACPVASLHATNCLTVQQERKEDDWTIRTSRGKKILMRKHIDIASAKYCLSAPQPCAHSQATQSTRQPGNPEYTQPLIVSVTFIPSLEQRPVFFMDS
jgi:hypothetical protein